MQIYCFSPFGYEGSLVSVEVDLRRGIPAVDIVGLADGARGDDAGAPSGRLELKIDVVFLEQEIDRIEIPNGRIGFQAGLHNAIAPIGAAECKACMAARMKSIGYEVVTDRGDYKA